MGYFHRDIASPHAQLEIAHRRIADAQQVQLFGFNRTIETAYETVWNNGGGIYSFPGSALTMTCVSSSASDTMSILIQGLDINYEPITDVVTLNGTTGVASKRRLLSDQRRNHPLRQQRRQHLCD
jgi:hypothetical protein